MCTICSHHETRGAASDPWQTFILRLFNQLKEECCVTAAVFDSSVSGSVVLQPAACLCSVNATAHAQIRRLELCTFSAQFSPFLLTFIAPAPDEAPTILSVTPHTTTSVLIRWQVSGRQFVLCFIVCKKR